MLSPSADLKDGDPLDLSAREEGAMNLSAIAIKRPVFTVMVTVALMVLGVMGLSRLGTDLFPDVSFPVVVVNVPYPGASPREVEQLVSKPIEDAVVSLNGIDRLKTTSREGLSTHHHHLQARRRPPGRGHAGPRARRPDARQAPDRR